MKENIYHLVVKNNKGKSLCGQELKSKNLLLTHMLKDVTCENCRKVLIAMDKKNAERRARAPPHHQSAYK